MPDALIPCEPIVSLAVINGAEVPTTTSLQVAKCFEKDHRNVLRDIREVMSACSPGFNALNFELVEYEDAKGEKRPMYALSKDGFVMLAMGYTGEKAMRFKEWYIGKFNEMEAVLREPATAEERAFTLKRLELERDITLARLEMAKLPVSRRRVMEKLEEDSGEQLKRDVMEAIRVYCKREIQKNHRAKPGAPLDAIVKQVRGRRGLRREQVERAVDVFVNAKDLRVLDEWRSSQKSRRALRLYCVARDS